jgi:hypothetical protein
MGLDLLGYTDAHASSTGFADAADARRCGTEGVSNLQRRSCIRRK